MLSRHPPLSKLDRYIKKARFAIASRVVTAEHTSRTCGNTNLGAPRHVTHFLNNESAISGYINPTYIGDGSGSIRINNGTTQRDKRDIQVQCNLMARSLSRQHDAKLVTNICPFRSNHKVIKYDQACVARTRAANYISEIFATRTRLSRCNGYPITREFSFTLSVPIRCPIPCDNATANKRRLQGRGGGGEEGEGYLAELSGAREGRDRRCKQRKFVRDEFERASVLARARALLSAFT